MNEVQIGDLYYRVRQSYGSLFISTYKVAKVSDISIWLDGVCSETIGWVEFASLATIPGFQSAATFEFDGPSEDSIFRPARLIIRRYARTQKAWRTKEQAFNSFVIRCDRRIEHLSRSVRVTETLRNAAQQFTKQTQETK